MNAWSNIEVSPQDHEIITINSLEAGLGKLPDNVSKIRELITRHEVCHFKCQEHIKKIKESIISLEPETTPESIGKNHIRHGENAWKNDATGRSLSGQRYVWTLKRWLGDTLPAGHNEKDDQKLAQKVEHWLGSKHTAKTRLVQLLVARLTWNWKLYEELQYGGAYEDLETQICRMDICHYAFPSNLDRLLQGIGKMNPVDNFEGCGSYSNDIRKFIEKELVVLDKMLKTYVIDQCCNKRGRMRGWLIACLMKTLKEQVKTAKPLSNLKNKYPDNPKQIGV